jgi:hypothetical protein
MKWFRSNIRRVSHIALFALAIQFVLSFGHFHGFAAQGASAAQSDSAESESLVASKLTIQTAENLFAPQPASDHGTGEHPIDVCAICAIMAMANTVLFATPPVVLLPQAVAFSYVPAAAEFVRVAHLRVAFQPRAPPIS